MKRKQEWKIGNKNAVKEVTASSQIQIRIEKEKKELFKKAAEKKGMTLSKWLIFLAENEIKNIQI